MGTDVERTDGAEQARAEDGVAGASTGGPGASTAAFPGSADGHADAEANADGRPNRAGSSSEWSGPRMKLITWKWTSPLRHKLRRPQLLVVRTSVRVGPHEARPWQNMKDVNETSEASETRRAREEDEAWYPEEEEEDHDHREEPAGKSHYAASQQSRPKQKNLRSNPKQTLIFPLVTRSLKQ